MKEILFKFKYFFFNHRSPDFYKRLLKSQFSSRQTIMSDSFNNFKMLFEHAYNNSIYYRKKYSDAGLKPEMIKSPEDINLIPPITKEELRNFSKDIFALKIRKSNIIESTTGGSTGTPLKTFYDKRIPIEAFGWRYMSWWGINPWDDGAYIWRMIRTSKLSNLLNQLAWWPTKKLRLDCSLLDENKLLSFRELINKSKPPLVQGYVGAITEFASFIKENQLSIHTPKCVWVTSAPLSQVQRNLIENVFDCPVYNEYGSSEVPWIAAQCNAKNNLHINAEGRLVEIVDKNNQTLPFENEGKLLVTDLLNFYFPIIRYENGDISAHSGNNCACGSYLPLLYPVKGRISDNLKSKSGKIITGAYLTTVFDNHTDLVKSFQFFQMQNYKVTLKVVLLKKESESKKIIIETFNKIKLKDFQDFDIELEIVNEIKSDRGKTRFVISELNG